VACLGIVLMTAGWFASGQTASLQTQIDEHEQKLVQARATQNAKEQGSELIALGYLYRQEGKMQKALECLNTAMPLEQNINNMAAQAMILNTTGRVYTDMGQQDKALPLFEQALRMWRVLNVKQGAANSLNNLGRAYDDLGRRDEALKALNESLAIWHDIDQGPQETGPRLGTMRDALAKKRMASGLPNLKDTAGRSGEASTLDNLGKTYSDMGRGKESLDYFNQALAIWRAEGEQGGEALTLTNMGRAYADLGQKEHALEQYNHALTLWRAIGNRQGEANTLNFMGRLYHDLGQEQMALDYYNQALPVWREVGNRNGEALVLNDLGRAYADTGEGHKSLEYFDEALAIWRETGNRRGEALTMTNEGRVWSVLGDTGKALVIGTRALAIWREVKDRRGESVALASIGRTAYAAKDPEKALASELAALALAKEAGDPEIEGDIEASIMWGFRSEKGMNEAILFGTDAVNSYQQIRKNISGLDKDLQAGFAQSRSATYRMLAELLVQADRLGEAEQVLDLLKEQELKEVVRGAGDSAATKVEQLKLTSAQQDAESKLGGAEKTASDLIDMSAEYATLNAKTTRSPDETARMQALETKIEAANAEVADFFRKTLYPELAQKAGSADANALLSREKSDVSQLQNTLAALGSNVMGIRLLLGEYHAYAIAVTAQTREKFELKATPAELRSKVLQVRDELRRPSGDPKPHLAELYAMVVGPLSDELAALERGNKGNERAPTLLWSLDGVMRYVPMAALYDGQHFMAERFDNILFTPESYGHMGAPASANDQGLKVLAMGLSKSYGGLPALPGVMPELDAVAHDPAVPDSHGPLNGVLLSNEKFTYSALKSELGAGNGFPVVHIASHFVMEAGSGTEPYLMLGGENDGQPDGFPLTLSRLEDSTISFHGTRLLTLSACSTAKGDVAQNGLEMDSLGMIAQQKDAEAVMATLWDVNDASTSKIMSDFYARWVKAPSDGKAEALRHAQLAFIRGSSATAKGKGQRGLQADEDSASQGAGNLAHPFYWAPFVLIGNYQ